MTEMTDKADVEIITKIFDFFEKHPDKFPTHGGTTIIVNGKTVVQINNVVD